MSSSEALWSMSEHSEQKTNKNIASSPVATAVRCGSAAFLWFSFKSVHYGQTIRQVTEELSGEIILIFVVFLYQALKIIWMLLGVSV